MSNCLQVYWRLWKFSFLIKESHVKSGNFTFYLKWCYKILNNLTEKQWRDIVGKGFKGEIQCESPSVAQKIDTLTNHQLTIAT